MKTKNSTWKVVLIAIAIIIAVALNGCIWSPELHE